MWLFLVAGCEVTYQEACAQKAEAVIACNRDPHSADETLPEASPYRDEAWMESQCEDWNDDAKSWYADLGYSSTEEFWQEYYCVWRQYEKTCDYDAALDGCDLADHWYD